MHLCRYFDRDVQCIRNYFRKKFNYESERFPSFMNIVKEEGVDLAVEASGFTRQMQSTFDEALSEWDRDNSGDENDSDEDVDSEANSDGSHDPEVLGSDSLLTNLAADHKETVDIVDRFADLMAQNRSMQPFQDKNASAMEVPTASVKNTCSEEQICHAAGMPSTPKTNEDDDDYNDFAVDELADLTNQNRATKPFRDETTEPVEETCLVDEISLSSPEVEQRTKRAIDVRVVKQKIKTQHQRQQAKLTARRTVKRGEAAVVTRARRHNNEAIQHRAGWDF